MTNYKISIKRNRISDFADHYMTKAEFIKFAEECLAYDQLDHGLDKYLETPVEYTEVEDQLELVPSRDVSEDEWFRAGINYFEHDGGEIQVRTIFKIIIDQAPFIKGPDVFYMTASEFVEYARERAEAEGIQRIIEHAQDALNYFMADGSIVTINGDLAKSYCNR